MANMEWMENFVLENFVGERPDGTKVCALCDNSGTVQTKFGDYACLCPNGRAKLAAQLAAATDCEYVS